MKGKFKMKVYVLNVFTDDNHSVFVFDNYYKVFNEIEQTLKDNYHFDTDNPYITEQELNDEIDTMKNHIYDDGYFDNNEIKFTVDECEVC